MFNCMFSYLANELSNDTSFPRKNGVEVRSWIKGLVGTCTSKKKKNGLTSDSPLIKHRCVGMQLNSNDALECISENQIQPCGNSTTINCRSDH